MGMEEATRYQDMVMDLKRNVVVVYFVHYVKNVYSTRFDKYEEIEEIVKIGDTCIGQDLNLALAQ